MAGNESNCCISNRGAYLKEVDQSNIAGRIAWARMNAGFTQASLGRKLRCSRTVISTLEAGDREPYYTEICSIAEVTGCGLKYLMEGRQPTKAASSLEIG